VKTWNMDFDLDAGPRPALNWRVLGLLNLYRVLVPPVLLSLYEIGGSRGISVDSPQLFFGALIAYFLLGLASIVMVRRRLGTADTQTVLQATVDVVTLMLLLHSCGGVASGLGLLLLLPVGGLSFLLPTRSALFLAAVAALAILGDTIFQELSTRIDIGAYATAGLLGTVLFTTAGAASVVAGRMRESEDLVRQKDLDLANLAELSQYIVQHLRESLLVVDSTDKIRLINESAAQILGDVEAIPGALIGEVSPRLMYSLSTWRQREGAVSAPASFVAADGARVIQPHFAPLGEQHNGPTLIFLEDTSLMAERVQQSKLAALGRLSASIAHEIRNPVGAMSHAGQLLAESPTLGGSRTSSATIRNASARSSTTCCRCRGARRRGRNGSCSMHGSMTSRASSARPCRSRPTTSRSTWTAMTSRSASTRVICTRSSGICATTPSSTARSRAACASRSASADSSRTTGPTSRSRIAALASRRRWSSAFSNRSSRAARAAPASVCSSPASSLS
jgi:two-component system sensor histidine kinase PilS (NtrC family)